MKKEKTIKAHQRRLKNGKVITVHEHKASYDAAEAMKEALKKKGAGGELEALKKKGNSWDGIEDPEERKRVQNFEEQGFDIGEQIRNERESSVRRAKASAEKRKSRKDAGKSSYDSMGFTKDEFKEWYEGTGSKADKKVEKALRKALGRKAYTELSDKAADSYKKGGASRFFDKSVAKSAESLKSSVTKGGGNSKIEKIALDNVKESISDYKNAVKSGDKKEISRALHNLKADFKTYDGYEEYGKTVASLIAKAKDMISKK